VGGVETVSTVFFIVPLQPVSFDQNLEFFSEGALPMGADGFVNNGLRSSVAQTKCSQQRVYE
jgi:hypothetical protein